MSRKQVKATKKPVVQPKRPKAKPKTSRDSTRAWAVNSGIVISDVIVNVAQYASLLGIQHAAQAASLVFTTIQNVQANKEDFQFIANDASELIIAIWSLQRKSKNPEEWASPEIRDMVEKLKTALENINRIAQRQAMRNMLVRILFNLTDAGQIRQTRQMINTAVSRFEVLSHIMINELLREVATNQLELLQGMKNLSTSGPRVEEREEEEEEEEEEEYDEDEEEAEDFSHLPPQQTRPTPSFGPNSAGTHGFSILNGSGRMLNSNVGNIANTVISNFGNNNSRNYYG